MKRIDGMRGGKHRDGKKHRTIWATDDEWKGVKDAADELGETVSEMIRGIGTGIYHIKKATRSKNMEN